MRCQENREQKYYLLRVRSKRAGKYWEKSTEEGWKVWDEGKQIKCRVVGNAHQARELTELPNQIQVCWEGALDQVGLPEKGEIANRIPQQGEEVAQAVCARHQGRNREVQGWEDHCHRLRNHPHQGGAGPLLWTDQRSRVPVSPSDHEISDGAIPRSHGASHWGLIYDRIQGFGLSFARQVLRIFGGNQESETEGHQQNADGSTAAETAVGRWRSQEDCSKETAESDLQGDRLLHRKEYHRGQCGRICQGQPEVRWGVHGEHPGASRFGKEHP